MEPLVHEFRAHLVIEMALAVVLGGIIGFERQLKDKPAGLRTHILICLGATIFTDFGHRLAIFGGDPGRVAGHVAAGVGFIGAGTIMQRNGAVTGLTTAANIWVVAAIGMALGFGAYLDAIAATVVVVIVLAGLGRLEAYLDRRRGRSVLDTGGGGPPGDVRGAPPGGEP